MNSLLATALALFSIILPASSLFAQESQNAPQQGSGAATSPADPLLEHLVAAATALQGGNLKDSREALDKALAMAPADSRVMNLNATLLTYERKLSEARKVYAKLLESNPEDFALNWNMAEVDFLEGNNFSARQRLLKLRETRPKDEMLTYKILLTHLFDGKITPAMEELDRIPFPSDTAAYYYGRAAIDFVAAKELETAGKTEEAARKAKEALSWTIDAGKIFRLQHNLLFADSLIEKKLIGREQITGLVPVPEPSQPGEGAQEGNPAAAPAGSPASQ